MEPGPSLVNEDCRIYQLYKKSVIIKMLIAIGLSSLVYNGEILIGVG